MAELLTKSSKEKIRYFLTTQKSRIRAFPRNTSSFLKLANLLRDMDIPEFSDIKQSEVTPPIIKQLQESVSSSNLYDFFSSLSSFSPVDFSLDTEKCIEELSNLDKDYPCISKIVGKESVYPEIKLKSLTMFCAESGQEYDFGDFVLIISESPMLIAAGNNSVKESLFHPFCNSDGYICLGTFSDAYISAIRTYRYADAVSFLMELLTVYKDDSLNGLGAGPHRSLTSWTGIQCDICDGSVDADSIYGCSSGQPAKICSECKNSGDYIDEYTGLLYMPHLLKKCEECGKRTIKVKNGKCLRCKVTKAVGGII